MSLDWKFKSQNRFYYIMRWIWVLQGINHGIPNEIFEKVKEESFGFFCKPIFTKQQAGLGNPLGYRHINIDSHGDMGEFEYLLLSAHPYYIAEKFIAISYDPS